MDTNLLNPEELQKKYSDLYETSNAKIKTVLLWNTITFFLIPALFFLPYGLSPAIVFISSILFIVNIAIMLVALTIARVNSRHVRFAIEQNTTLELAKEKNMAQLKQRGFWLFRLPKYWRYSLITILIFMIIASLLFSVFCSYDGISSSKSHTAYLICNDRFLYFLSKIIYILPFILFFRIPKFK